MMPMPYSQPDVSAGGPLRVACVDDERDFAALRPAWNALLRASRSDCFFLTWEWLHAWWKHLRGGAALSIFVVCDDADLVAIAPLGRSRTTLPWLTRLEFLGTGSAGSDYLDVIVRGDREREASAAIADAMMAKNLTLRLDHLPPAPIAAAVADRAAGRGWASSSAAAGTCPFILLRGHSWDSYLASLGAAHRANFRRRLRNLDRQFEMRFTRVSTETERLGALPTLMHMHNQRWDTRGGSTAFPTPASRAFHDEVARLALRRGWLRLYELRLNGEVVAATYCFSYHGRFYFYQGAFDDRYRQHSVGMVAMGLTIRAAIEEGAREFDMLYGVESYKWLWAREARQLHRVELFPPDVAGRLHRCTVRAERSARTLARRIFPRRSCSSNVPPAGAVC